MIMYHPKSKGSVNVQKSQITSMKSKGWLTEPILKRKKEGKKDGK